MKNINNNQFPIKLKFNFWNGYEAKMIDSSNRPIGFVKQKIFKLKEHIEIFSDNNETQKLYDITTQEIIDFSASYNFTDSAGNHIGSVRRKGWKSVLSAHYDVYSPEEEHLYTIEEVNPFIRFLDTILDNIPIINLFTGLLFNPEYALRDLAGNKKYTLKKMPSLFSREFKLIDQTPELEEHIELAFLSFFMLLVLERRRG